MSLNKIGISLKHTNLHIKYKRDPGVVNDLYYPLRKGDRTVADQHYPSKVWKRKSSSVSGSLKINISILLCRCAHAPVVFILNTGAMVYGLVYFLERFAFLAKFFHSAAEVTRIVAPV